MTDLGLPEACLEEAKTWSVLFDFDGNSCYPAAAVAPDGTMNGGLDNTGNVTGGCRNLENFLNANTYYRKASFTKDGVSYSVHMYALYFQKDQVSHGLSAGHRHDWEYVLVWTLNGALTHASFSAHGEAKTIAKAGLSFDSGQEDHVKAVYHKESGTTHSMRPAKQHEAPENERRSWVAPTIVDWGLMQGTTVTNEQLRRKFNTYNYGGANCSFNDRNFPNEIAKSPPQGYPSPAEWRLAALPPPPPEPAGLVARWLVRADRDPDADNRTVALLKGQIARIVVNLPEPERSTFRFNLKHDKRGVEDRGRTDSIGHGAEVRGDAHDWPSFGERIYLGERNRTDVPGLALFPNGFYVDLVRV